MHLLMKPLTYFWLLGQWGKGIWISLQTFLSVKGVKKVTSYRLQWHHGSHFGVWKQRNGSFWCNEISNEDLNSISMQVFSFVSSIRFWTSENYQLLPWRAPSHRAEAMQISADLAKADEWRHLYSTARPTSNSRLFLPHQRWFFHRSRSPSSYTILLVRWLSHWLKPFTSQ